MDDIARKKMARVIAIGIEPEGKGKESPAPSGHDEGKRAAADELIAALGKKDTDAVVEALESFIDCCSSDEPASETEEPDEE